MNKALIDFFLQACGTEFPFLQWTCEDIPGAINAIARSSIPELAAILEVEWFFPTPEHHDGYAVSRIIIGKSVVRQELFRSTWMKDQSLPEALSKLRHYLEFVQAGLTRSLRYKTLNH